MSEPAHQSGAVSQSDDVLAFGTTTVAQLMPMHLILDEAGKIAAIGPTLQQVMGKDVLGEAFFDVFCVDRPRKVRQIADLRRKVGAKLVLTAIGIDGEQVGFRAMPVMLSDNSDRIVIDLSFGEQFAKAITRYSLTAGHFKPNDPSMDLLYSFEIQRNLLKDSEDMAKALKLAKAEAEDMAMRDSVTGLGNRRALQTQLKQALSGANGKGPYILMMVDLDKFKAVNDDFGHAAGDAVLRHTAACLSEVAGKSGFAARMGGDEFVLLLRMDMAQLDAVSHQLRSAISSKISIAGVQYITSASLGYLTFEPGEDTSPDQLLSHVDVALYHAKVSGNRVAAVTPELLRQFGDQRALTLDIERALRNEDEFLPYFHPQIDLESGEVIGVEALARWNHPQKGVISPAGFLGVAAKSNLLLPLDRQVRRRAMSQFSALSHALPAGARLSLNITAAKLRTEGFIDSLLWELDAAGLVPEQIKLELLETIFFDGNDSPFIRQCTALREAGFGLALDDFGTGRASISTLIDAPISMLKIDRSFVSGIDRSERLRQITGAIIRMAYHIRLAVLAEGVENAAELQVLSGLGCRYVQGFHFAKPMDAAALAEWLAKSVTDPLSATAASA